MSDKHIYFASDFHLGVPTLEKSHEREKRICRWLDSIKPTCAELFLVGDLFDFWWEYTYTVPKGTVRLLGKVAEFTDAGIPVHFFVGNHDLWMKDYFVKELGVSVHHHAIERTYAGKKFMIGHGDGLGPGDYWYKVLRVIFASKFLQWCYSRLHPNLAFYIARGSSRRSKEGSAEKDAIFLGKEKEWLYQYCRELQTKEFRNYYIFGHRHLPLELELEQGAKYINLGDWIRYTTYAVFDGSDVKLLKFEG
ncbi:MAG: UDP-2,3-diacylglucosamine diphosphatase [Bacteroidia bacterium]|jgi:UDP-2,3-diacylglucosamine hydrolase|nr:UDP-2,3-diacylglucosamine diphosphatase [Bacteroidia bacterium]